MSFIGSKNDSKTMNGRTVIQDFLSSPAFAVVGARAD